MSINRRRAVQLLSTAALTAWLRHPLESWADESSPSKSKQTKSSDNVDGDLPYLDRIGLQLYTVRDQMKQDPKSTLKAIADAGYRQVELMSIDEDAIGLAGMARDAGLMVHSGFMDFNVITAPDRKDVASINQTIEWAERIGLRHIVFGYIARTQRDTADKCRAIASRTNTAAEATRKAGMRMCYHNHAFEFGTLGEGDQSTTAFDIFIERFDPQFVEFELDVFWAKIGGHDPLELMKRLAGRISQVHLKDLQEGTPVIFDEAKVPKTAFEELGDGVIPIPNVMRLAKSIGVDQCHVEQDQSPAPLQSISQSAAFLRSS
ncbi:MAG: sugar phosphate isomerase/epimerase family protein [Planctomycetota bacterium]